MTTENTSPYEKGAPVSSIALPARLNHLTPRSNLFARDLDTAMDVDHQSELQPTTVIYHRNSDRSRPSSWHSEEDGSSRSDERPTTSFGLSRSRSYSGTHNTSQESFNVAKNADDPLFHEAFRLFKISMKHASEKYGPYLPPDDGSPFLAHRLNRMWTDLSSEQRAGWYARAAGEMSNLPPDSPREIRDANASYSPTLHHLGGSTYSPSLAATSARRSQFPTGETNTIEYIKMESSEVHSPHSMTSDEHYGGSSTLHSRSQSPSLGESSAAHIPRPPNAWILFRSTMSKSRRPDGAVYSPPEISVMWANLPKQERDVWYERAKEAKLQHEAANPGYKYQPRKKPYNSRKPTDILTTLSATPSSRLARPPPTPTHMAHSRSGSQI